MLLRGCDAAWCWQGLPGAHPLVGGVVGRQLQEGPQRGRHQAGLLPSREDVHELRQRPKLPAAVSRPLDIIGGQDCKSEFTESSPRR